jgi:serine/threonine protein kinase
VQTLFAALPLPARIATVRPIAAVRAGSGSRHASDHDMPEGEQRERAQVGTVLEGAYRLLRLLGEGGMGAVYEAVHLRLDKKVAVKVMARELAASDEALARFRREVQVTSKLAHPHIVQVSDFGTAPAGEPFLVMEYLEGEDLSDRLDRVGRLPLAITIAIANQIGSALAATHAKGIVHRDLKPENLFLLRVEGVTDFVKVVDFGISKVKASSEKLTRASVMMGTPAYMAPEQATGRVDDIDHRTDQWALACIIWEMLSGDVPFAGKDTPTLLYNITHGEPPALKGIDLPPDLEAVLRRALSKRQGDRFPTIAAFSRALSAAAVARPAVTATPAPVRPKTPAPARTTPPVMERLGTFVGSLVPRRKSKRSNVVAMTMAMGMKAFESFLPQRKKRPRRWLAWASVAVVAAGIAGGALWFYRPAAKAPPVVIKAERPVESERPPTKAPAPHRERRRK